MQQNTPKIVISSMWRNDTTRNLVSRAEHLLSKTCENGDLRWVWAVGDSEDSTEDELRIIADHSGLDVEIIRHDTNIIGDDPDTRMIRLCETGNAGLDCVRSDDTYWIIHESDLQSPIDVVDSFLNSGKDVIAGWVTLRDLFYDTYGYTANGRMFSNYEPYHPVYRSDQPFELDTVGSCFMFPAQLLRDGTRFKTRGVRDICWAAKAQGLSVWCDPYIHIVQPENLWKAQGLPQ